MGDGDRVLEQRADHDGLVDAAVVDVPQRVG
jgi:hypothetical protein